MPLSNDSASDAHNGNMDSDDLTLRDATMMPSDANVESDMDASLTADVGEDHPQMDAGEHPDVESSPQDGDIERDGGSEMALPNINPVQLMTVDHGRLCPYATVVRSPVKTMTMMNALGWSETQMLTMMACAMLKICTGNLDGVMLRCRRQAPECPMGMVPAVEGGCYTNECVTWAVCAGEGDEIDRPGVLCGSRGLLECPRGQFCNFPINARCGATDIPGRCAPRPEQCNRIETPCVVAMTDYANPCMAYRAGILFSIQGCVKHERAVGTTNSKWMVPVMKVVAVTWTAKAGSHVTQQKSV